MEATEIQSWLFHVEPSEGESLSHFLGRFRRANELTPSGLGKAAGIGAVVARWEKFHLNPFPTRQQLEALAVVVGVSADRLAQMLPPLGVGMNHTPIRLCGACYAEEPCHKIEWQFKVTAGCDRHQLRLLSECPHCKARFAVPALWVEGACQRCFTTFGEMARWQKSSLTAAVIATLVITKAFEKVGEKLGEEVFTEGGKLTQIIRLHSPQTGSAIELAQQQPLNYGEAVLKQVEADAQKHPEIAAAVEQVAATAKADPKFPQAVQKLEEAIKSQTITIHN